MLHRLNGVAQTGVWEETKSVIAGTADDQAGGVAPPGQSKSFSWAFYVANEFERNPRTLNVALQAYRELISIYGKSKNRNVARFVASCEGAVRRLELLGRPMKLWGSMLDGRRFDPASVAGKVVLVEVVNLHISHDPLFETKSLYEQYHDKGFEIVAVVLDDDQEREYFQTILKEEHLSWPTLVTLPMREDPSNGANAARPASLWTYYGFTGDAQAILLNRKGEVVSLNARGAEARSKLKELLGEPARQTRSAAPALGEAKATADPNKVPDGTPEELLKYIRQLQRMPRQGGSGEQQWAQEAKEERAIAAAADKILAAKPTGQTRAAAIRAKLDSLDVLGYTLNGLKRSNEAAAIVNQLQAVATAFKDDSDPQVARQAREALIKSRSEILSEPGVDLAAAAAVWTEMKAELQAAPDDGAFLAEEVASKLALNSRTTELAVRAYRDLIGNQSQCVLAEAHPGWVESTATTIPTYYAAIRWLRLAGHPFQIHGTLADGKPFDPSTTRGKVALVEFGSIHCGSCVAEVPNMKRCYEKYHARGFEVVEVVPEGNRPGLRAFREQQQISWPILCEPVLRESPERWTCGMFDNGAIGSPPAILIDRNGNVVSTNPVGDELGRQLAALLGDPEKH